MTNVKGVALLEASIIKNDRKVDTENEKRSMPWINSNSGIGEPQRPL